MPEGCISPQQFSQFLLEQLPIYEPDIIRDIRPTDGLIGHVDVGTWDPFDGTQHTRDRFKNVQPDVTAAWERVPHADTSMQCNGSPCDPTEHFLCWGSYRNTFYQERQSWRSQMLCFDQVLTVNKAVEHVEQIVADILRPATSRVNSFYIRKRLAQHAGAKWLATSAMTPFTYTWNTVGNREITMTTSGEPTSKLTPQMLQRRVAPLRNIGYFGRWTNDPFWGGYDSFIELLTDDDTAWDLDKITSDLKVNQAWRFQQWDAAHQFYKYGMGGQLGNYMVHIDPFPLRFNKTATNTFQVVLPYRNIAPTSTGIGSENNPDFFNAQYQFSIIHHRFAVKFRVQRMEQVNPLMPFAIRDLSGQWRWANHDLGHDCNNNPIANYRENKGFFYADFQLAADPIYTEWEELIFHKREPAYVYEVDTCADDPGYPTQYYNSACESCGDVQAFTPLVDGDGNYVVTANTITCDGNVVTHVSISAATIPTLVSALNNDAGTSALGTWVQNGTDVLLTESECDDVIIPWVV